MGFINTIDTAEDPAVENQVDQAKWFVGSSGVSSIMEAVIQQQLGLGLILSTLLITVPPMAGLFFNGVMGNYTGYGVFDRSGVMPTSVDGGRSYQQQVENRVSEVRSNLNSNQSNTANPQAAHASQWSTNSSIAGSNNPVPREVIKTQSQIGLAEQPRASGNSLMPESQESNKTKKR